MTLTEIIGNYILGILKIVLLFIILKIAVSTINLILNCKKVKNFFNKEKTKKIIKWFNSTIRSIIATVFIMTVISGVFIHISDPNKFPGFTIQLAIASLTYAGISVAMATLFNDIDSKKKIDKRVKSFKFLAQDFVISSIYLIFAYFFGLVLEYSSNETSTFFKVVNQLYSVTLYLAIFLGVVGIITGIWKLLNEMNTQK